MNGLSISGQRADQKLQTETEITIYKLLFLYLTVRHDQTLP